MILLVPRASEFRTSQETTRVIKLIDAQGNKKIIKQQGRMGITRHVNMSSSDNDDSTFSSSSSEDDDPGSDAAGSG